MKVDVAAALGRPETSLWASGWSVDTRTLNSGDVFFALQGPSHDGHDHVAEAERKGASAAVVSRAVTASVPTFFVEDTLAALQQVAEVARSEWNGTVIAVTGSAGKTSCKDAIAHLMSAKYRVGKTSGNFNNHVGVPLSILRLPDDCEFAVLEMGMNHAGEIRDLAGIARPQVGVVTNVGYAHSENFDGIDGIALAKRELIEELPAEGVAVLNADDPRVARFREVHPGSTVTYGLSEAADVRATGVELGTDGVRFRVDGLAFDVALAGVHNVRNVLAAIAVGRLFGVPADSLRAQASTLAPSRMRGERILQNGITIWNDCYNSNPEAARSMIDVLRHTPAARRIAVLGEMLELGEVAEPLHRQVGRYVAESGIDVVLGIRGAARHIVDEAIEAGMSGAAYFFEEPEAAGDFVRGISREGDAILFKGSRGVRVERAMDRVLAASMK